MGSSASSLASKVVTVDNFVRAETDMTFGRYAKQGAFGKFLHIRQPTPIMMDVTSRKTGVSP